MKERKVDTRVESKSSGGTARYLAWAILACLLVAAVYALNPKRLERIRGLPSDLRGGRESDVRLIGEIDLESLFPGIVLRKAKGGEKLCALTFDDGPDNTYTPHVLDIMKEKGVKATFFLIGRRAEENPDITKRIIAEGHLIGNHTYSHPSMVRASADLPKELASAERSYAKFGVSGNGLFRPPYGAANPSLVEQAKSLGYKTVLWSVDSLDWTGLPKARVLTNIQSAVSPGAVILQHCAGGPGEDLSGSVLALPDLIDRLRADGYRFVTIKEMFPSETKGP